MNNVHRSNVRTVFDPLASTRLGSRIVAVAAGLLLVTATAFAATEGPAVPPTAAPVPSTVVAPEVTAEAAPPVPPRPAEPVPVPEAAVATPVAPAPTAPPTTAPPPPRAANTVHGTTFAVVAGLELVHPATTVERVGFHESSHDGAQPMEVVPTTVSPMVLPSRARDTPAATAADVVVAPDGEIRAPVSGTVKRSGGYVLYCHHRDEYVVIAPDAQPHLEVKLLHIRGVQVPPGARVTAGQTVVAQGPTPLPFDSQVDEFTAEPSWPHVHIEVVDPAIKDRPSKGGGCH